jgi:hypothetical protein
MRKMYIPFLFVSYCVSVYSFHSVESLMIEHMMSMAVASKTSIKHKPLSMQENLYIFVYCKQDGFCLKLSSHKICKGHNLICEVNVVC